MRPPSALHNPDDSEDSDNNDLHVSISDFYSDEDVDDDANNSSADGVGSCRGGAGGRYNGLRRRDRGGGGGEAKEVKEVDGPVVPEWSELETAVQALMGMDEMNLAEDGWDETESAR